MLGRAALASVFLFAASATCLAQEAGCGAVNDAAQSTIKGIQDKYAQAFKDNAAKVTAEAKKIEGEADENKPGNVVEGTIKFKIDVSWHTEKFSLDLPTVTVRDQEMSFDLPEVTMGQQIWKYDIPQTKLETQCVKLNPRITCASRRQCAFNVCIDVLTGDCTTTFDNMCTDVPVVYMSSTETLLGVPEVAMRAQKIVVGVPEVTMKTTEISFDVPDFKITDIQAEMNKTKDESDKLQTDSKANTDALSQSMQSEIKVATSQVGKDVLTCHRNELEAKRASAIVELDKNISVVQAALTQAVAVGASTMADGMRKSLEDLVSARAKINGQFDTAIQKMSDGFQQAPL
jgi:hypothetical protein